MDCRIMIDVCTDEGWQFYCFLADAAAIKECHSLHPKECRAHFWNKRRGQTIPTKYRTLIWWCGFT